MTSRDLARKFRKNPTKAEDIFWQHVRDRKLFGKKINRQHSIRFKSDNKKRFFIADFYCPEVKLIIEIDGIVHKNQKEYDEYRTYLLNYLGYKVIRFNNYDILNNLDSVFNKLKAHLL